MKILESHIDSLLKKSKIKCLIHEVLKLSLNLLIGWLPQNIIKYKNWF